MEHHYYLKKALQLARRRRGFCSPNPAVGAVVVSDAGIVSEGYHYAAGHPHAEVIACQHIPSAFKELSLYVTLEPCCHWGKTPPCTDLIVRSGIKNVIFGYQDPNQKVAGKGEQFLKDNGINCERVDLQEISEFYRSYTHWLLTGKPWVTCKLAISLDAKIADASAKPVAITGVEAQQYTHIGRLQSDAILTSARTIIQDNPALNVRLNGGTIAKRLYIIDRNLSLPVDAKIFETAASITLFYSQKKPKQLQVLKSLGVICREAKENKNKLDLEDVLMQIGRDGIHDLWVEAGGNLFNAFLKERLAHKSIIYIAPKLLGNNAYSAFSEDGNIIKDAKKINWHAQGDDAVCEIDWV